MQTTISQAPVRNQGVLFHCMPFAPYSDDPGRVPQVLSFSSSQIFNLIEKLHHYLFVKDAQGRFVELNQNFADLFGKTLKQMIGTTDYDYFPKERADFFNQVDRQVRSGQLPHYESEEIVDFPSRGKLHIWVNKTALRVADGSVTGILGIF